MRDKMNFESVPARLAEHPAVRAWHTLRPGGAGPERLDVLKEKPRSSVYRLMGVDSRKRAVIAKRQMRERRDFAVERLMYEEVLPQLQIDAPAYLGCVAAGESKETEFCWLFVEDVGPWEPDPNCSGSRGLVSRWLASFHLRAATIPEALIARLPDHGPQKYEIHLRSACQLVQELRVDRRLDANARATIDAMGVVVDSLQGYWTDVEEFCAGMPRTLVHGDCLPKNLRVRRTGSATTLVPIDWATAGWGLPAADLGQATLTTNQAVPLDVETYWHVVREGWPRLTLQDVRRMALLGRIFWCLYVTDVTLRKLIEPYANVDKWISYIDVYQRTLTGQLSLADWRT